MVSGSLGLYICTSNAFCQQSVHLHVSSQQTVRVSVDSNCDLPAELGGGDLDGVSPFFISLA
jgi:hypothetical protein